MHALQDFVHIAIARVHNIYYELLAIAVDAM